MPNAHGMPSHLLDSIEIDKFSNIKRRITKFCYSKGLNGLVGNQIFHYKNEG